MKVDGAKGTWIDKESSDVSHKRQPPRKKAQESVELSCKILTAQEEFALIVFFGITMGGTIGIIFSAPHRKPQGYQQGAYGSEAEERLLIDIFKGYNPLVRPANVSSVPVEIAFGLALELLINVDEKNQVMQTNVWPTMVNIIFCQFLFFSDNFLSLEMDGFSNALEPTEYANIRTIRVPPGKVWLPDIVLFNNADGNYEVSFYSNVVVEHTGEMLWVPPAIYKSSCTIDVEFFPFDEQTCEMIFGSWTFNQDEVTIKYLAGKRQVELTDYSPSGIWDIMEEKNAVLHCYPDHPTVLMAFLSMLVFYLPAEADEKITLAISILLALVVFLLLVSKILHQLLRQYH
uniref:Neurotransmitter-gated ion-channel ligand-binding domain-containing protein n=1 Tax=Ditylenchus dipsaci TaxID=166011 RepID=A0A915EU41_9BILA